MSDISLELEQQLSARAEAYYPNVLPYHNWDHARDVMEMVAALADMSIAPEIMTKRSLLVIAAAWHDADYAAELVDQTQTKEERSAALAAKLLPELSGEDRDLLVSGIIDTTVAKKPKANLFGEVLHAADVGYFAAPHTRFMARLVLMRQEWGSPSWEETVSRTVLFGRSVIKEAEELMPRILSRQDADTWIERIKDNLAHLKEQPAASDVVNKK
jgi:hypothetical protein